MDKPDHSVPVPDEVYAPLRIYATQNGLKLRFLIAEAIRAYLKDKKRRPAG